MRYLIRYRHGDRKSNTVALTFDDGPSDCTPEVLDFLKARDIKATFFLIPENIEKLPEIARRIVAEGHEIGGHAHQPDGFSKWKSFWTRVEEDRIVQSCETIRRVLGIDPHLFRPSPEMGFNRGTEKILKQLDLIPVLASAYSRVSRPIDVQIKETTKKLRGGDIVLLHDGHDLKIGSARPKDTLKILPAIIDAAREKGLLFVKTSELLGVMPYRSTDRFARY